MISEKNIEEFKQQITKGNLSYLSRAITFAESQKKEHQEFAQQLIKELYSKTGNSWRIAITGVPGVGKSTFINSFGKYLIHKEKKVAVLAVDPSSSISGGSILGDKTRMIDLANSEHAFIRPSPTSGFLGGITNRTYESILLCEAAGFNIILVETVGVGQSELEVKHTTDCFLLLKILGAGDDLQGIKRGIMEMMDFVFINKSENYPQKVINIHRAELINSIQLLRTRESDWTPKIITGSGLLSNGFDELFQALESYFKTIKSNGFLNVNRENQNQKRVYTYLQELFIRRIEEKKKYFQLEKLIQSTLPSEIANRIFENLH